MNHTLENLRPIELDGRTTPVPDDVELDSSPRPVQMPSGEQVPGAGAEHVVPFETPGSMRCEEDPAREGREMESKGGESGVEPATCSDAKVGPVVRAWKRGG
eukprot:s1529_g8.t1